MWAISFEGSAPVHDTHAAGLPIHVLPSFIVPPRAPQQRLLNDPIVEIINPREILSLGNLYSIHRFSQPRLVSVFWSPASSSSCINL